MLTIVKQASFSTITCDICGSKVSHAQGTLLPVPHLSWCPSTVVKVTAIDGTWGWHGLTPSKVEWTHPDSALWDYLRDKGLKVTCDAQGRAFTWSTSLTGHQLFRRLLTRRPNLTAWEVGAVNLINYQMPDTVEAKYHRKGCETHMIAHSHGGNLPYIAAAMGLKINVLVTVSTPVRHDVLELYGDEGRKNIGYHIHYWSVNDKTQIAGSWADGHKGIVQAHPLADLNIRLAESFGHTGLLKERGYFSELLTAAEHIHLRHGRADYLELRHAR